MITILARILATLLTEKMIIKVSMTLLGYLVKSTKNTLDDQILNTVKEELDYESS